ncbi:MAG: SGNH/GDSL hydrolase family protein [Clostridiales bacterium]|nr:SGNH/GDSL hydrolase family protein [Clostridiales bacterium]
MKKIYMRIICGILCVMIAAGMAGCSKVKGNTESTQANISSGQPRYEDYIFVGDSRFVGMKDALNGYVDADVRFVAEVGQGLGWLKKVAPDLYNESGKTIIFNLGVNDLYNVSGYVDFYNNLPQDFVENNTLVIMTVNPVDEQREADFGYSVKNSEIESFNNTMRSDLDSLYFNMIDSYTYVQSSSFKTTDGLHYTNDTYRLIFDYAVECCQKQVFMKR